VIAALCLLVAVGAGFMAWRSKANFDSFRWGGVGLVVMTSQGKVCLLHTSSAPTGPDRTGLHTVPFDATRSGTIIQWPTFGYSWPTNPATGESKLTVVAPLWFVAALFATPAAWWLFRGRHSARLADEMD
jgi:hypothetical protein